VDSYIKKSIKKSFDQNSNYWNVNSSVSSNKNFLYMNPNSSKKNFRIDPFIHNWKDYLSNNFSSPDIISSAHTQLEEISNISELESNINLTYFQEKLNQKLLIENKNYFQILQNILQNPLLDFGHTYGRSSHYSTLDKH
jgi:hypothetical protein